MGSTPPERSQGDLPHRYFASPLHQTHPQIPQSLDFGHYANDFAADGVHESEDRGGDGEYADVGAGQTTIPQQGRSQDGNGGEGYPCRSAGDEAEEFARFCRRWRRRLDGLAAAIVGMIVAVMMMVAVAVTKVHGHSTARTSRP